MAKDLELGTCCNSQIQVSKRPKSYGVTDLPSDDPPRTVFIGPLLLDSSAKYCVKSNCEKVQVSGVSQIEMSQCCIIEAKKAAERRDSIANWTRAAPAVRCKSVAAWWRRIIIMQNAVDRTRDP